MMFENLDYIDMQQGTVWPPYSSTTVSGTEYHGVSRVQVQKQGTFSLEYGSDIWLTVEWKVTVETDNQRAKSKIQT